MADVNRGNRPLSPHLQIYRPTLTMTMSALHRISGIALTAGCVIVVLWLFAAATSREAFATVEWLMTSWLGALVLLGSVVALWYHALNGLRHLAWDAGWGLDIPTVERTGKYVLVGVGVLTLMTLILA